MSIRTKFRAARRDDRLEVRAAELGIELEPERRSSLTLTFESRPVRVDRVEHLAVRARDRARLVDARDLLAEHVDRRQLARRVQRRDDAARVVEIAGPAM